MLLIGDSAGMIAPLCGNGMSMALVGADIAATLVVKFLRREIDRAQLELHYQLAWNKQFARRLAAGRIIQSLFGKQWVTNTTVNVLRYFPGLVTRIIRQTHG